MCAQHIEIEGKEDTDIFLYQTLLGSCRKTIQVKRSDEAFTRGKNDKDFMAFF